MINLIDVYPYRLIDQTYQFLILKRSRDVQYAGQWRMVGGKVEQGEKSWKAALRELEEETGITPVVMWAVPSLNHFYNHSKDQVELIPAFAAEVDPDTDIILNREHSLYQWIEIEMARELIHWPEQLRLITLVHTILTSRELLDDWKISF